MLERDKRQVEPVQGGNLNALLGSGSRVTGKLVFEGPALIEGQIDGEITAQDTLTIGESAVVDAQITGTSIVIHGRVTGDVTARKRLEIRASAKLSGRISTPRLVIHEGGVFEGQCAMGDVEGQHADKDKEPKVALFPKEGRPTEVPAIRST
jgi:cytoskeletal protein CcmA (bactofilin family)